MDDLGVPLFLETPKCPDSEGEFLFPCRFYLDFVSVVSGNVVLRVSISLPESHGSIWLSVAILLICVVYQYVSPVASHSVPPHIAHGHKYYHVQKHDRKSPLRQESFYVQNDGFLHVESPLFTMRPSSKTRLLAHPHFFLQ